MRLALPAPPEMFQWIADRAPIYLTPAFQAIAAIDDDGRIAGMVGYDGWTDSACSMHVAFDTPIAAKYLLRPAFEIPFLRLDRQVIVVTVLSTNAKSLHLTRNAGFREVMRGRDWWKPGVDLVWFEMRREDCRFIRKEAAKEAT